MAYEIKKIKLVFEQCLNLCSRLLSLFGISSLLCTVQKYKNRSHWAERSILKNATRWCTVASKIYIKSMFLPLLTVLVLSSSHRQHLFPRGISYLIIQWIITEEGIWNFRKHYPFWLIVDYPIIWLSNMVIQND